MWHRAMVLTLLAVSVLGTAGIAHGACSTPYFEKAYLNEYFFGTSANYLEVFIPNNNKVTSTDWLSWKARIYTDTSSFTDYPMSGVEVCTFGSKSYLTYHVPSGLPGTGGAVNVVLLDGGNNEIDYLRFNNKSPISVYQAEQCIYSASHDIDYLFSSYGNKDVARFPDGSGDWSDSSFTGANTTNTRCASNDASISKAVSAASIPVGASASFTISISNPSNSSLSNVVVTDTWPTGLIYDSNVPSVGTYNPSTGVWTVGSLAKNSSATLTLNFHGNTVGPYTNTATMSYTGIGYTAKDSAIANIVASLDHVRLNHTGSGVTCSGSSVTVTACNGADVGSPPACVLNTNGLTGNVVAKSGATVLATVPFAIAAGSSSTTVSVPVTTAQTVTFEVSGLSVTPSNAQTCWNGSAASCSHVYSDSGFLFNVLNHVSETLQSVTISAVKKSDNSLACVPAFSNVSKSPTFTCQYSNPVSGTLPVRVANVALNATGSAVAACDATGQVIALNFNASGVATTTVQYADVGNMLLNVRYAPTSGTEAGLVMTGADNFIAAPASFTFSAVTTAPIRAGTNFSATVTARNAAQIPAATPNFGKESIIPEGVTLTFAKCQPTGLSAVNGVFTGSVGAFNNGIASANNLVWSEVGNIDLIAMLASGSYLGSGLTATGNSGLTGTTCTGAGGAGTVGRFIPHHFDTVVTEGSCVDGFSYSGQPFSVKVTAMNGLSPPSKTFNYDGTANTSPNFAKNVTLSDGNGSTAGNFSASVIAATSFSAGSATGLPVFTFTNPKTAPLTLALRATDGEASSLGFSEGTAEIRSGRLRLQNAYGSELLDLPLLFDAQYWAGNYYVTNLADNCTVIPASSIIMDNYVKNLNACETQLSPVGNLVFSGGRLLSPGVKLTKPGAGNAGSVNLTANTGVAPTGKNCVSATESNATAGNVPWFGANPVSRATFGVYKTPIIYMRENY